MRSVLLLLLGLGLMAQAASAQMPFAGDGEPLEIYAEQGIEWNREAQTYVARGNARAIKDDTEIRADLLRAYYSGGNEGNGDIYRVEAVGGVVITSPSGTVYGDHGNYDVRTRVMVLTGRDLRLVTQEDVVTARDSLEYWEVQKLAVARGKAEVTRTDPEKGTTNIIRADVMTANFAEKPDGGQEMEIVDAYDNVEILTPCEYVTADRAHYLVTEQLATLNGNVKITRGNNQLNGDVAEMNMATGISTLKGDRVQGLLVPESNNQGSGGMAPGGCQ